MNVPVKKFFKVIFWLFISLIILSYIALQATYYMALKDVKHLLVPSQNVYSETIKDVTWVEYSGRGEIEIYKLTPVRYVFNFFSISFKSIDDWREAFPPSQFLIEHTARAYSFRNDGFRKRHPLPQVSASIWISQNFSEDEIFASILDNGYFGKGLNSISETAYFYFDKKVEELNLDEIVLIMATQRSPSYFNPITEPERHEVAAQQLQKKLNENWPEKYADYVYTRPEIVNRTEAEKFLKNTEIPYQYLLFSEVMLKYLSHSVKSN